MILGFLDNVANRFLEQFREEPWMEELTPTAPSADVGDENLKASGPDDKKQFTTATLKSLVEKEILARITKLAETERESTWSNEIMKKVREVAGEEITYMEARGILYSYKSKG